MCSTPASSAGRPATVTPNTTSSRPLSRPSRMPHAACITRVQRQRLRARARDQRSAQRRHRPTVTICSGATGARPASPRRQPRALLEPGQRLAARPHSRGRAVLPGDARPDSRGTASPAAAPPRCHAAHRALEQLPHQDRRRPAVHQQVMVADQQPMPLRRQPDQRKPHQRRRRQIEPLQRGRLRRCCSARAAARPHPAPTDRSAATAPRARATITCTGPAQTAHARSRPAGSHAAPPRPAAAASSTAASSRPSSSSSSCTV